MDPKNISRLATNFRTSLKYPGYSPVVDEEDIIFDTQEFNRRIVDSVRVSETEANKIEGINIDEQRRITELPPTDMIHNEKQHKDIKDSYPVQIAEFSVENRISEELEFAWWVK